MAESDPSNTSVWPLAVQERCTRIYPRVESVIAHTRLPSVPRARNAPPEQILEDRTFLRFILAPAIAFEPFCATASVASSAEPSAEESSARLAEVRWARVWSIRVREERWTVLR